MSHSKRSALGAGFLALAIAALLVIGRAPTAHANGSSADCTPWVAGSGSGAGAIHMQCTFHNAVEVFDSAIPCGPDAGLPATVTITYNGVLNITELTSGKGAGTFWATGTQTGTFAAVPTDSSVPTYTGHTTSWFGDNNNLQNGSETSTFTIHAIGSDGSSFTFHEVQHLSVSASGVTTSFDSPVCS